MSLLARFSGFQVLHQYIISAMIDSKQQIIIYNVLHGKLSIWHYGNKFDLNTNLYNWSQPFKKS